MNTETDTFDAKVGVLKTIRAYRRKLEDDGPATLVPLIRLLHATLDADEILASLHQGVHSEKFSELGAVQRLQLMHFAGRWGAAAGDIEAMVDSFTPDELPPGSTSESIVAGARKRLAARADLTSGPIGQAALIPIGSACLGWTMPNRWGLRRTEDISRLFNPMALAVHRPRFVVKMITDDFDGYLDTSMLKVTLTAGGFQTVARADGGALWNHCVGPFWSDRVFRQFTNIMAAHLDRFRTEAFGETGTFRVFLFNLTNVIGAEATRDQVFAVADALASRVKGPYGVIGIDSNRRDERPFALTQIGARVALLRAAPPDPDYHWANSNFYNAPEGIEFEARIMKSIQTCVADWADPGG